MKEPSVLDYVKSLLMPWKGERIVIPQPEELDAESGELNLTAEAAVDQDGPVLETFPVQRTRQRFFFLTYTAVLCAIFAQTFLEPPNRQVIPALVLYLIAAILLVWALIKQEWQVVEINQDVETSMPLNIRWSVLGFSLPLFAVAYLAFANNRFSIYNVLIGVLLVGYLVYGFYLSKNAGDAAQGFKIGAFWQNWSGKIQITRWHVLLLLACVVVIFFRYYRLDSVPQEMISDHAEKLLDVGDVLSGQTSIFFPRNSGREAFQFYLTALIIKVFGTGLTFLSLKIGTATAGVVTLIYVYLLGKEIANRRVGLLAVIFAGVAYWPNVIARIGLRFALYPLFVAPALYYLIRGLRRQNRNDFIWSGIALGIGLHGYSPMRIVPFVLVILVLLYLLHRQADGKRTAALVGVAIISVVSLAILMPLVRYALEDPQNMALLGFRAFSRLGAPGQAYPAPPLQVFFSNLWNAWTMFFYDNGEIWAHSIPHRPALDLVTAAFYFIGSVSCLYQYIRSRHWMHLFLLVSVPLLMLPSILSLTFPGENPSLNRTGAAYIPVFLLAAVGFEGFLTSMWAKVSVQSKAWVTGWAVIILIWMALLNYDLVFNQYATFYAQSAWNNTELGQVAKGFKDTFGAESSVFVVAYPYWVDGRLVAINGDDPRLDYSLLPDNLPLTLQKPGAKLFLLSGEDQKDLDTLRKLYPFGVDTIRPGQYNKKFAIFIVPQLGVR